MADMIQLSNVSASYGAHRGAFRRQPLRTGSEHRGDLGAKMAGQSTTLNVICGIVAADQRRHHLSWRIDPTARLGQDRGARISQVPEGRRVSAT